MRYDGKQNMCVKEEEFQPSETLVTDKIICMSHKPYLTYLGLSFPQGRLRIHHIFVPFSHS
jgi:hypothetical protein